MRTQTDALEGKLRDKRKRPTWTWWRRGRRMIRCVD